MINTSLYLVFLIASVSTILSPGPGVLMATSNAMRYGLGTAHYGIMGCAFGTLITAAVSVTGLGLLIATTPTLYACVKACGILFLVYLGWKKFRAKPFVFKMLDVHLREGAESVDSRRQKIGLHRRFFLEGIILQMSNPALIIFYLSLFPQCIDQTLSYRPQVILLSVNYAVMVWLIHCGYGWLAARAAQRFLNDEAAVWINRVSGAAYWLLALGFGVPMAFGLW